MHRRRSSQHMCGMTHRSSPLSVSIGWEQSRRPGQRHETISRRDELIDVPRVTSAPKPTGHPIAGIQNLTSTPKLFASVRFSVNQRSSLSETLFEAAGHQPPTQEYGGRLLLHSGYLTNRAASRLSGEASTADQSGLARREPLVVSRLAGAPTRPRPPHLTRPPMFHVKHLLLAAPRSLPLVGVSSCPCACPFIEEAPSQWNTSQLSVPWVELDQAFVVNTRSPGLGTDPG